MIQTRLAGLALQPFELPSQASEMRPRRTQALLPATVLPVTPVLAAAAAALLAAATPPMAPAMQAAAVLASSVVRNAAVELPLSDP